MKKFTIVLAFAAAMCFAGCEATRQSNAPVLYGQICAFGYCLTPAVDAQEPPPVVVTQPVYAQTQYVPAPAIVTPQLAK